MVRVAVQKRRQKGVRLLSPVPARSRRKMYIIQINLNGGESPPHAPETALKAHWRRKHIDGWVEIYYIYCPTRIFTPYDVVRFAALPHCPTRPAWVNSALNKLTTR